MATNRQFDVDASASLPVGAGVEAGDPVRVGDLVGIALTDRGKGGNPADHATVALRGVFRVAVEANDGALAAGETVWITSAGALNNTAAGNKLFGHAYGGVVSTETVTIPVRIVQG